ncbi:MAG TPA: phasin family protein [Fibrobacteria bacterium]|nr:phasin family protein [Fibrobacteria bacterium]
MLDSLKKALYTGVGLAYLTRDKLEDAARRIAEEARLSEPEGRKLVEEMLRKAEDARASLERTVSGAVSAAMERVDAARRGELKALEARVQALEESARRP